MQRRAFLYRLMFLAGRAHWHLVSGSLLGADLGATAHGAKFGLLRDILKFRLRSICVLVRY
jgi:hypothetical protein